MKFRISEGKSDRDTHILHDKVQGAIPQIYGKIN